jgi:hypothetical protein
MNFFIKAPLFVMMANQSLGAFVNAASASTDVSMWWHVLGGVASAWFLVIICQMKIEF